MTTKKLYATIVAALVTVLGLVYVGRYVEHRIERARVFAAEKDEAAKQIREFAILCGQRDPDAIYRAQYVLGDLIQRIEKADNDSEKFYWYAEMERVHALTKSAQR